ncbi:tetratricopeptide repeat protein [Kordia jejudonensis]|uniref:tetratricopeptide repeat protein n=1 Tax=Kordia jejudonensis TaxID=1348245 RepID=UPI00062930B9|nr:tetratricopeptide repeat protein [Kordia jejudonensis]
MHYVYVICFFAFSLVGNAQEKINNNKVSVEGKSYDQLANEIYKFHALNDTISVDVLASKYLRKGIYDNDSIRISEGYLFMSGSTLEKNKRLKFLDSSLFFCGNKNKYLVPASTYLTKSVIYSRNSDYKKALNNFILAHNSAEKSGNDYYKSLAKYNIGIIKSRIGLHEEALVYAKDSWNYHEKMPVSRNYLWSLSLLSSEYSYTGELNKATDLNTKGIIDSKSVNDTVLYSMFVLLEGINQYHKKNYKSSIDSINKSLHTHIKNDHKVYEAASYLYLGKSYYENNEYSKAISNFKKVDSIFHINNGLLPKSREAYIFLIENAKKTNDLETQLYYTNQLLKFDNLLQNNYQYISSTIYKQHEQPILLSKKQRIINVLKSNNNRYLYYVSTLMLISIVILIILIVNYKKKKKYKSKFDELMSNSNITSKYQMDKKNQSKSIDIDEKNISW